MIRRPPRSTRTDTLFPYTTLFRSAQQVTFHPLRMRVDTAAGHKADALAINEVSLLRESRQAAKIGVKIDGVQRLGELICDVIMVANPAGRSDEQRVGEECVSKCQSRL